jgi:hypothetical protein
VDIDGALEKEATSYNDIFDDALEKYLPANVTVIHYYFSSIVCRGVTSIYSITQE